MIGPIVLVCRWKANSSKELIDQPRTNGVVSTVQDSQFSRSLQTSVTARHQKHTLTYIRVSQHTCVDHNIIQFQVRYCGELRNKALCNAVLAIITSRDLVRLRLTRKTKLTTRKGRARTTTRMKKNDRKASSNIY
jgi:hypothetical protein